jgi:hypothetical protein
MDAGLILCNFGRMSAPREANSWVCTAASDTSWMRMPASPDFLIHAPS